MSAEDIAAIQRRIPQDQFDMILRAIRETVRAEMRAEFEGREAALQEASRQIRDLARAQGGGLTSAHAAQILNSVYAVPPTIAGVPV